MRSALEFFGPGVAQPSVYWYGDKAPRCDGDSWEAGFKVSGWADSVGCVGGMTYLAPFEDAEVAIMAPLPDQPMRWTAICHEMAHAVFGRGDHPAWLFGTWDQDWDGALVGDCIQQLPR